MNYQRLVEIIRERKSYLCVGLDTDPAKIPAGVSMLEFNKAIIDATKPYCVAYKPNIAFYECLGAEGWEILEETVKYIGNDHFTIADAKRGDIGNTSTYYAKTFFETYGFDSVTVAPYMGKDSVQPFLAFENKWAIVLALTSNPGAMDFQLFQQGDKKLFEEVLEKVSTWGTPENTMYVVGATRADMLADIRKIVPNHFLLVPGVGAQGGSLEEVAKYGMNENVGLLVNASRSILYASNGTDFASAAEKEAKSIQLAMAATL
ncbi:MAG: orotidine-5'-phosphate decarboxylase [Flavobacteriales bacterium]